MEPAAVPNSITQEISGDSHSHQSHLNKSPLSLNNGN